MKITSKLWIGIGILIILSPLGIFLPHYFKSGTPWGEESLHGPGNSTTQWNAPLPSYTFKGWEYKTVPHLSVAYIFSAVVGIALIVLAMILLGKLLARKEK